MKNQIMTEQINFNKDKSSNRNKVKMILRNYILLDRRFLRYIALGFIIEILFLAYPFIGKLLLGIVEKQGTTQELITIFVLGGVFIFLTLLSNYFIESKFGEFRAEFNNKLVSKYREKLGTFDIATVYDFGTGKLISKLEQGISAEESIFFKITKTMVSCIVRGVGVLILYIYYDFKIFMIMVGITAIYVILEYKLKKKIEDLGEEERKINEQKTSSLVKFISEFQTIKIWNKICSENNNYDDIVAPLTKNAYQQSLYIEGKSKFLEIFFDLGEKGVIFFFAYKALTSGFPIADIYLLANFIWWLRRPLAEIVNSMSLLQSNISKYTNLQEFLDIPQAIINGTNSYQYKKGNINIDTISFSYNEDKQILHNFSLDIPGGKTLALVGNSGSGKSTIVKLLLRLYDPVSGKIMIDNQNLKDLEIETLYDTVGYLTQEPAVFDGSIYENMMYGAPRDVIAKNVSERNDEAIGSNIDQIARSEQTGFSTSSQGQLNNCIRQALDHAKCDFVRSMKDGLETQIGERGVKLSGGEKQRLAIARIFFKNPHILIFDEPTAALDSISEHHITSTLHELFADKTVIVIAHRLQTVMNADAIIVLEEGKIVQSGKHEELLLQDGLYKQLVDLQSGVIKEE